MLYLLEKAGASGVVLEDQRRPRKCGHLPGKQILEKEDYLVKLKKVLATRRTNLFVIARTDSSDPDDIRDRIAEFAEAGADGLLVDGVTDISLIQELVDNTQRRHPDRFIPFAFNQITGGKSPVVSLSELWDFGVRMAIYSTPCLFAAQEAISCALEEIFGLQDGKLPGSLQSPSPSLEKHINGSNHKESDDHHKHDTQPRVPQQQPHKVRSSTVKSCNALLHGNLLNRDSL